MKLSMTKTIVGILSIISAASMVGGVAGTVAWFQYSTRTTAGFSGQVEKCSENLRIRIHDENVTGYEDTDWSTDLSTGTLAAYLTASSNNSSLTPVTALKDDGGLTGIGRDDEITTFKANPIRQHFEYASWEDAHETDYVVIPLQFKLVDVDGTAEGGVFSGKEVYLADLTFQEKMTEGKANITDPLRANFDCFNDGGQHSYSNWSKDGGTIDTHGKLDLDGDGELDKSVGYEWDNPEEQVYGSGTQSTYSATGTRNTDDTPLADDADSHLEADNALVLGTTDDNGLLNVTITIWLEGWQPLPDGEDSDSVWSSKDYINSEFYLGMRFVVDALA